MYCHVLSLSLLKATTSWIHAITFGWPSSRSFAYKIVVKYTYIVLAALPFSWALSVWGLRGLAANTRPKPQRQMSLQFFYEL